MSDSHREERPLLCDDYSDEELHVTNYNCQRRSRLSVSSGRARTHAKGAVTIITRWPDHWSTSAGYWWLGISMIAITIFVIYNCVMTIGMLQPPSKQHKFRTFNNGIKSVPQELLLPEVYMHLLTNNDTAVDLHKYLPYIDIISRKYSSYKYRFILVLNDTSTDVYDVDDEKRNEIAFNSLWTETPIKERPRNNISIEHISLTTYLNSSPVRKFWRHLPRHLIEFLIRSVSIWEKGGIAFNPLILTPESPNPNYINKLHQILKRYMKSPKDSKLTNDLRSQKNKMRPNNIRDIINALEKDNINITKYDLTEAENKDNIIIYDNRSLRENLASKENTKIEHDIGHVLKSNNLQNNLIENVSQNIMTANNTEITKNILPLFLEYLFRSKSEKKTTRNNTNPDVTKPFKNIDINPGEKVLIKSHSLLSHEKNNSYENPVTTYETKHMTKSSKKDSKSEIYDNVSQLSVDIKGNIIASKTACHAFLGTLFSNVIHYNAEETLSDFIISELSLFCKGLITSCNGVDVILV